MSRYRRAYDPGGTFFLTLVTFRRQPLFADAAARRCLHDAIAATRAARPFDLLQNVLLPDHLHLILRLPEDDADFSTRVSAIKATFTRGWLATVGAELAGSASRERQRYRGVWQKRFWEHVIVGDADLARCEEYIWFNPVKHGLVCCPTRGHGTRSTARSAPAAFGRMGNASATADPRRRRRRTSPARRWTMPPANEEDVGWASAHAVDRRHGKTWAEAHPTKLMSLFLSKSVMSFPFRTRGIDRG